METDRSDHIDRTSYQHPTVAAHHAALSPELREAERQQRIEQRAVAQLERVNAAIARRQQEQV